MPTAFAAQGGAFLMGTADPRLVFTPEDFTAEDLLIGKTADDFLQSAVMPHVERIESGDHDLMHRLMQQAGELGLLGADVPEIYGGLGLKQTVGALIAEKINPQQSFALTHEAHTVIATFPLMFFGNDAQKRKYLPKLASGEWIGCFALSEANSGSDALAMQTRAVLSEDGTHYVVNGEKMWITNTAFAQLFSVFGKVDGKVTVFLVERDFGGVSFGKEEHKLGMHGTSTRRVILENVRVPIENVLEVGKGHYAAFCALNLGRFKLEAGAVGGLKYILKICTDYAKQRKTFGKPIASYGMVQHKLAEMAARTFALESMVYRLAGELDSVFDSVVPDADDAPSQYHRAAEEFAIECNIVKVLGSEAYSQMADEAIQIHGGYGYTEEFPVARAWRDQRLLRIGEGANEIVRVAIANLILRRDAAGRLAALDEGKRASETLSRSELTEMPLYDDPLDGLAAAARDAKTLALFLLFQAKERLGEELMEMQEIPAAIADIVIGAYALESMEARCRKMQARGHARFEAALLAAQTAQLTLTQDCVRAADYVIESLPSMDDFLDLYDDPFNNLSSLLARLTTTGIQPMQTRRALAAHVLERGGWVI